jgi:hypothetical protein
MRLHRPTVTVSVLCDTLDEAEQQLRLAIGDQPYRLVRVDVGTLAAQLERQRYAGTVTAMLFDTPAHPAAPWVESDRWSPSAELRLADHRVADIGDIASLVAAFIGDRRWGIGHVTGNRTDSAPPRFDLEVSVTL